MNLPGHKVHDCTSSYGRLIVPIPFTGRWLLWTKNYGFHLSDPDFGFHNCTVTGVH